MVICLERDADLHMAQLMPPPLTVSCFTKIQIGFTFLVPADPGSPAKKGRETGVCVCVCVCRDIIGELRGWRRRRHIYRPKDLRRGFSGEFAREVCVVAVQRLGVAQFRAECRFLHQLCVGPRAHNTTALQHSTSSVSVHVHTTQQHLNAGFSTSSVSVHVHTTQQHFNTPPALCRSTCTQHNST